MQKLIIKISCLLMCFLLVACTSNNNSPVELRVQDGYIQYDNGSGWTNLISTEELKGEQGEQGIQGEKGETGDKGEKGDKGDKGDPGTNGTNGTNGKDGTNGVDGKDGVNGKDGANGVNGKDGKDGIDGKDGVDGKDATVQDNITKEFYIDIKYVNDNPDTHSDYGSLVLKSQNKAVIQRHYNSQYNKSNISSYEILMNENGKVEVEAKAEENWKFVKWSDGSTQAKRTISYNDSQSLTAYFDYTKIPMVFPELTSREVDYKTKDWILTWDGDENAKDYTITLNDGQTFTSTTNSLTIPSSKLKSNTDYTITIKSNPADTSKYMNTVNHAVNGIVYYYSSWDEISYVPSYTLGITTLDEYKKQLVESGLGNYYPYANIVYVTDGATSENDGTIANVNPEVGSKIYTGRGYNLVTVSVYHAHNWQCVHDSPINCEQKRVYYRCEVCNEQKSEITKNDDTSSCPVSTDTTESE